MTTRLAGIRRIRLLAPLALAVGAALAVALLAQGSAEAGGAEKLRALQVPEHGAGFWEELEAALGEASAAESRRRRPPERRRRPPRVAPPRADADS